MKNRLLRSSLFIVVAVAWLVVMCLPILAFWLATQGEIEVGQLPRTSVRVFMVQSEDNQGLGIQWNRPVNGADNCARTSVRFLLWGGDGAGQNTSYCLCYESTTNQPDSSISCP